MKKLKIKFDILSWCSEDYTDLIIICDFVNSYFLIKDKNQIKKNALKTIQNLLEEEVIVAGILQKDNTLNVYNKKTSEVIKEIEIKWNNLNRQLQPHELVWFDITEKGKKEFEYLKTIPEAAEVDPFYLDDN
jgi:hypothetical protein